MLTLGQTGLYSSSSSLDIKKASSSHLAPWLHPCRLENLLPLTLLGAVMGYVFVSTRNLLASMVLHSFWNVFTLYSMIFR
jgi:membrane protease YdiL (CAAX protease family)